ncbi:MAG: hypothetical protein M1477_04680 [Candidatus Thermoplasmatota archaeon]|nr:hypothetical protein [Candidatus Thermoplasmatota archaeon]
MLHNSQKNANIVKLKWNLDGNSNYYGFHKFDAKKIKGVFFLDVADSQYDITNPERILFGYNSAINPGRYSLGEVVKNEFGKTFSTDIQWNSAIDFYVDYERNRIFVPDGINRINIVDFESINRLLKSINLPVKGVISATLDSQDRIWFVSSKRSGGDGNVYMINDADSKGYPKKMCLLRDPTSIDSVRISPWGRKILVSDYGSHKVFVLNEDGEILDSIYHPFVSGIRALIDERAILSSGKYPMHSDLLILTGGLHNVKSSWFGYLTDYGVQPSNRADLLKPNSVMIQWFLGFGEISLPIKKDVPFVIQIGQGNNIDHELIKATGFDKFTPIIVFGKATFLASDPNVKFAVELLIPRSSILSHDNDNWITYSKAVGRLTVRDPGIYRIQSLSKTSAKFWAVCSPK